MDLQNIANTLNKKGFLAEVYANGEEARKAVLDLIPADAAVGIGGSVTIRDLGLSPQLKARGNSVYWHWENPNGIRTVITKNAAEADYYLCSTNALTQDGVFINIDGTGNRVSGMFFGPAQVILVCGRNKIAKDEEAALDRIKNVACPKNAVRLNLKTPCAITGKCSDCKSPQRMCRVTTYMEYPTNGKTVHVLLVDEDLGY